MRILTVTSPATQSFADYIQAGAGVTRTVNGTSVDEVATDRATSLVKWPGDPKSGIVSPFILANWKFTGWLKIHPGSTVGLVLIDKQTGTTARQVEFLVNQGDKTFSYGINGHIYKSGPIAASISWDNRLRYTVSFRDNYVSFELYDGNVTATMTYRYNLTVHQTNPVCNFGLLYANGGGTWDNIGLTVEQVAPEAYGGKIHLLVLGDSISACRQLFPETLGWPALVKQDFYDEQGLDINVETFASGSANTSHIQSILAAIDKSGADVDKVALLIGDNDPANNLSAWQSVFVDLVQALCDNYPQVYVLSLTYDRDDDHSAFAEYILDDEGLRIDVPADNLFIVDTTSDDGIANVLADGVHRNQLGHRFIADRVYDALVANS